jgi:nicotinamidase-related amidase
VIVKRRVGAFTYTDLELILRSQRIETVVLFGVATSGVVLSTLRYGSDAGFKFVIADDACADMDDEVHRVLTTKVFVRQATVAPASEVAAALS